MIFSSAIFLFIFLPFTIIGYYLLKENYRNAFFLIMSLLFYAWGEPIYIFVVLGIVAADYLWGWLIVYGKRKYSAAINKLIIVLAAFSNLMVLFYFKYFNFFMSTVSEIEGVEYVAKNIALPIGISFYIFQAISYLIDLYRGTVIIQKNPLKLLLYVSLFPHMMAGPIVRYSNIYEQIDRRTCTLDGFSWGARKFIIGLAKKVILANQFALVVDTIFALPPSENSLATAWLGAICYTLQIYFDFSGYSDMAIGLAKIFGFDFLENFNYPYISKNVTEFWRRWHISLSSWFRDYVYIPLGGNRTGNVYVNLLIVFFVTGLWHGAAWNFIIWGLWHGAFLICERILRNKKIALPIPGIVKWAYTLLVVILGWVLFRSPDLSYAINYIGVMFGLVKPEMVGFSVFWYLNKKLAFFLIVAVLASVPWKAVLPRIFDREGTMAFVTDRVTVALLLILSMIFVITSTYNPFIYFRF